MINTVEELKVVHPEVFDSFGRVIWPRVRKSLFKLPVTEEFLSQYAAKLTWEIISRFSHLSEEFIDRNADKVDWEWISCKQKLSGRFIERNADKVDWGKISEYQKLSQAFIRRNADKVVWWRISHYQKLSESFIERYSDKVDWEGISCKQKLSEAFIDSHADKVDWGGISRYQKLSESFIDRYADKVDWEEICKYQKLSKTFIKKHIDILDIDSINDSWHYVSTDFKKQAVLTTGMYECSDDFFIAYKGIRSDNYSAFNFQYLYEVGNTYDCFADHSDNENSFGLSVWTKEMALSYCREKLIRVKIRYEDVARIVHNGGKIRCSRFEVLDEVN